ncbi:MAG: hypothetical protein FD153_1957 [Rhodospirillaceae bacterium]|nr:MAG: hypothetical protein FD153_1957 [Rhodospirillaceae bacterium]
MRLADGLTRRAEIGRGLADLSLTIIPRACHGKVVLVSDFLDDPATLERVVHGMTEGGVRGHLLQVLDPAEETLPFAGRIRFVDLEDAGIVEVSRVQDLQEAYARRIANHRAGIATMAGMADWTFAVHRTDALATAALLSLFMALETRQKS